jgi:hypothetical protein
MDMHLRIRQDTQRLHRPPASMVLRYFRLLSTNLPPLEAITLI